MKLFVTNIYKHAFDKYTLEIDTGVKPVRHAFDLDGLLKATKELGFQSEEIGAALETLIEKKDTRAHFGYARKFLYTDKLELLL